VEEGPGAIGVFSGDARTEAIRDETPAINLVHGQELASSLQQYGLSVKTVMVEKVVVDEERFQSI
jgi:hypothetical protein